MLFDHSGVLGLYLALRATAGVGAGRLSELVLKTAPTCPAIALARRQSTRAGVPRSLFFGFGIVERRLIAVSSRLKPLRIVIRLNVDRSANDFEASLFKLSNKSQVILLLFS